MFKESLRNRYEGYWFDKKYNKLKSVIIEWIDIYMAFRFCYNKWMIFNSKYSGISKLLDGSEDGKFRGCQDIKRKWDYSNWNYDELYWDDDYVTSSYSDE